MTDQGRFARTGQTHNDLNALFRNIDIDIAQAKHMTVFVKKLLLRCPVADMLHRRFRVFAKHLVEVADLDLDVISHDQSPDGAPAGGAHIPVIRGQK